MVEYNGLNLLDLKKIIVCYFFCLFVGPVIYSDDVAAISLTKAFLSIRILLDLFHNIKCESEHFQRRREYLQHLSSLGVTFLGFAKRPLGGAV